MYALEELQPEIEALRQAVNQRQPFKPLYVKIKLNYGCNLRCEMCKHWREPREQPMPISRFAQVISELAQLGCRKIHISGGEPLLHPETPDLIQQAANLGIRTTLTTNGTLLDKALARRLVESGLRGVNISIDSPQRKIHDPLRGVAGAWKKSVRAVQWLRRYAHKGKLTIRLNCLVSRPNYLSLAGYAEFAHQIGADAFNLIPVDDHCGEHLALRWQDLEYFNQHIAPQLASSGLQYGLITREEQAYPFGRSTLEIKHARRGEYAFGWYQHHPCYAPWTHSLIDFNGRVYVCCMGREQTPVLGDLHQSSFGEIWQSDAYRELRNQMHPPALAPCRRCDDFLEQNRLLLELLTQR